MSTLATLFEPRVMVIFEHRHQCLGHTEKIRTFRRKSNAERKAHQIIQELIQNPEIIRVWKTLKTFTTFTQQKKRYELLIHHRHKEGSKECDQFGLLKKVTMKVMEMQVL